MESGSSSTEHLKIQKTYLANRGWDVDTMSDDRIRELYYEMFSTSSKEAFSPVVDFRYEIEDEPSIVSTEREKAFRAILDLYDLPLDENTAEQLTVFMEAMCIFVDREKRRKGLWRRYGWMDSLMHIRSKAARAAQEFWGDSPVVDEDETHDLDDALDLLNYTVFFIRNFRSGNKFGDM